MTDTSHALHRETVDEETGEVLDVGLAEANSDPEKTLSERAAEGIMPAHYWSRIEAVMGDGGPDYELAFFNAQSEIQSVIEADAQNVHLKNRYATLAGLLARVRPILTRHRLTIKQYPGRVHRLSGDVSRQMFLPVCTCLRHVDSGQYEIYTWEMPVNKMDPQALGSLSTYARRFAISGVFGIATVDDDAASASIRNKIDREQGADIADQLIVQINDTKTTADLKKWMSLNRESIEGLAEDKVDKIRTACEERLKTLQDSQDATPAKKAK